MHYDDRVWDRCGASVEHWMTVTNENRQTMDEKREITSRIRGVCDTV